jgi:thioesterase domain-containing protein
VHASGGSAVPYVPLVNLLDPDQPVYGIEAVGLHGELAPHTVPELAERYLDGIRGVAPHGPYVLAGWSVGGTIAVELAAQLRDQGEPVPAVILLDCAVPPGPPEPPHATLIAGFMGDVAGLSGRPANGPDPAELVAEANDAAREAAAIRWLEAEGLVPAGMHDDLMLRMHAYLDTVRATLTFTPRPFDGALLQCIATERDEDYHHGWDRLGGTVLPRSVPGSHYTILQPPNVDQTGAVLREFLDGPAVRRGGR